MWKAATWVTQSIWPSWMEHGAFSTLLPLMFSFFSKLLLHFLSFKYIPTYFQFHYLESVIYAFFIQVIFALTILWSILLTVLLLHLLSYVEIGWTDLSKIWMSWSIWWRYYPQCCSMEYSKFVRGKTTPSFTFCCPVFCLGGCNFIIHDKVLNFRFRTLDCDFCLY